MEGSGLRNLGYAGLFIGVLALVSGSSNDYGKYFLGAGGLILASALVLIGLGIWEDLAGKRLARLDKDQAISQLERLARLRDQGAVTDEEYTHQKREILGLEDDDDS
jgi:hypothetical protein